MTKLLFSFNNYSEIRRWLQAGNKVLLSDGVYLTEEELRDMRLHGFSLTD